MTKKLKALIVDDSEVLRIQVRQSLEMLGFAVIEAVDGFQGFDVAKANSDIDLIITDLNMPGLNGIKMTEKIRELPGFSTINILMLTTDASKDSKAIGKKAGVTAWIVKPFIAAKMMPEIKRLYGID